MAVAACSLTDSKPALENPNIYPTDFRREILLTLPRALEDQTNVRDALISDPALTPVGKEQRYTVCVRYNARNANHQYMGSKDRIGYFFSGHLNQLVEATKEQCGNAAYKPFPELEKLCMATKCE
jgi:hypothetical protein